MAREKIDNKLNVVIGTKAQIDGDTGIPENSIIDEELQMKSFIALKKMLKMTEAIGDIGNDVYWGCRLWQ